MWDPKGAGQAMSDTVVRTPTGVELNCVVRRGGAGVPFLLVHGLASNARLWDDVGAHLADAGHDSTAVDQRSHGLSLQTDGGFDFATLANDLAAVVGETLKPPVIAVGQSWGGNVVLELADRHHRLVQGAVLVDGGFIRLAERLPVWEDAARELAPPDMNGVTVTQITAMLQAHSAGFPPSAVDAQLANFRQQSDGTVRTRLPRTSHMTILRHLWEHDPDEVGARLDMPISAIAVEGGFADRDRVARFASKAAADVQWVEGHHDIHAQQPRLVADLLIEFARDHGS